MKRVNVLIGVVLMGPILSARAADAFDRCTLRLDMGGVVPEDATLTGFGGSVLGEKLKLDPAL